MNKPAEFTGAAATSSRQGITRRGFLHVAAGTALYGALAADLAQSAAALTPRQVAGEDPDLHLLRRISFGPTPAELARLRAMGQAAYLEEQLGLQDFDTELAVSLRYPLITGDATAIFIGTAGGFSVGPHIAHLQAAMLYRAVRSRAQLFEVMVDFWNDHFNTYIFKNPIPHKLTFDRDVIRAHALGNFKTLLRATVRHAEMLHYLDNWLSAADAINENYARELLELHTLGRDGGYTEADLKALARILSGLSYAADIQGDPLAGIAYGDPVFVAARHDASEKTFLGQHFGAGGGEEEIDRALDIILAHPGTARHIARKLCQRFVSDAPPPALIARVADSFTATGGDIPAMLRVIFGSAEFAAAAGQKLRRPLQAMVGGVRACAVDSLDQDADTNLYGSAAGGGLLFRELLAAGQQPFGWAPPNGYPDDDAYWSNTNSLLHQQKFLVALAEAMSYSRLLQDPLAALEQGNSNATQLTQATTAREAVDNALANLLLMQLPHDAQSAALAFVAQDDDPDATLPPAELEMRVKGLVFALLSSPWFLRR